MVMVQESGGLTVTGVRRTTIKVVPTFVIKALRNEPIPIFGDGEQEAVYIYIKDAVEALLLAADRDECDGKVISVGSTEKMSVKELAMLIVKLTNSKSPLEGLVNNFV